MSTAFLGILFFCTTPQSTAEPSAITQDIKFRDFFQNPVGSHGLQISDLLQRTAGHRIRIVGYMVAQETAPTGRFFLTPLPIRMSEHADGDADDLPPTTVVVLMPDSDNARSLPHTPGLMQLTGVLEVGRRELDDGRVSWVRLRLDPPGSPKLSLTQ
jgi:hypothetical protein